MTLRSFFRPTAVAAACLACCAVFAQQVTEKTNIDQRWNRTVKAGPFSEISTSWGVLMTSVPLVELAGRGNTGMGFSIYHHSNQASGTFLGVTDGGAGRGFSTSITQTVDSSSTGITWSQGANSSASWTVSGIVGGVPQYARTAGTRADLTAYMVGNQVRGWDVVTQGDKTRYVFRREVAAQLKYRLTQIVDANGNVVNFYYDTPNKHRVTRIVDASGQRNLTIGYTTDLTAQVSSVTLNFPGGSRRWDFAYVNWYLSYIDYPAPTTGGARPRVFFNYDANSNIIDLYDLKGHRWHYAYSNWINGSLGCRNFYPPSLAAPTTSYDTLGTSLSFAVSNAGPVQDWTKTCTITDRRGWNWKHVYYNSGGNTWFNCPIKETWDGGFLSKDTYRWNYTLGSLTSHIDRRGWTTSFTYDTRGNMLSKTDREGRFWRWIYYQDKPVTQIDPTGNRTITSYYTPSYNVASVVVDPKTDPNDWTYNKPTGIALLTNFTYTPTGELEQTWTGNDTPTTQSNFDAYGNARTVTPPSNYATTFTFDELGNKLSATEPLPSGTTTFAYDNWNRLKRTTFPGGAYTETTYDNVGNTTSVRDANGFTSTMAYDGLHRLSSTTQPVDAVVANNIVVTHGYDVDSNRTSVTNGRGRVTIYTFNSRNQLTQITYPDYTTRRFDYDGNGNRTKRWDGQNRLTNYTYDKEDRLTVTTYPDATTTTNFWRSDGLRDRFTDATGTTPNIYNGAKQLVRVYQPVPNKWVTYTYDTSGRKKTTTVGSQTWTLNYDSALRLWYVNQTVGAATPVTYGYNPNGSVQVRTFGSGYKTVFDYDPRGRLNWLSHRTPADVEQQRLSYTYDNNSNVLTYRDNLVGGNNWLTTYTHDRAGRLLTEARTGGASFNFNNAYAYDKNGNRTTVTRGGVPSTYSVDNNDKLLSGDGFTFSGYSADGNPGSTYVPGTGTVSFLYDYENRVKQATLPTRINTYRYNADGQRVEQVSSQAGPRRYYAYDGWSIIAETDTGGSVYTYFLPGVGYVSGTTQFYYRDNALGSTVGVTNTTGVVQSLTEYDAYGIEYTVQAGAKSQFRFAGKHGYQTDADTGLDLLGHRYYSPKLGRFLTQDPIGHEAGLNLYAYCNNSPLVVVDPEGTYEVRLAWHGVLGEAQHAFILITDNVRSSKTYGWTWGFSAGPERFGIKSLTNPGRVVDRSGLFVSSHFDAPEEGAKTANWVLSANLEEVAPVLNHLNRIRSAWNEANWQYNLSDGPNSNTFAHMIVDAIYLHDNNIWGPKTAQLVIADLHKRKSYSFPGWSHWGPG